MTTFSLHLSPVIESFRDVDISVSKRPLSYGALDVSSRKDHTLEQWTTAEDKSAFAAMQKGVRVWEKDGIEQYLIYGKSQSSKWELVPFHKPWTIVGRIWNQFLVLIRTVFGGAFLSASAKQMWHNKYKTAFQSDLKPQEQCKQEIASDPFCTDETIEKQSVFEGKTVRILYNYAPIGFGGERLHFLIVPKLHKEKFSQLSEAEYIEACSLSRKLLQRLEENRSVVEVHHYHKTGVDAGQTVPHWHMHVVVITSKAQGFFGKLTVLKNMLIGSSPMKGDALSTKVKALQRELEGLNGSFFARFLAS
ncbi:MAG: HIT family protein [Simkaniaceae bacterium]|nr:HIT family protein [Candidatus Sacchlamyda saccharinae]